MVGGWKYFWKKKIVVSANTNGNQIFLITQLYSKHPNQFALKTSATIQKRQKIGCKSGCNCLCNHFLYDAIVVATTIRNYSTGP